MILQRMRSLLIVLLPLTFFGCGPGPNGPESNWGHMMGYGYGGGFMWTLVLIVVGAILWYLLQSSKTRGSDAFQRETPLDILKKRYARGELDKEAFDRMKKDVES